jgi:hypothetical protein
VGCAGQCGLLGSGSSRDGQTLGLLLADNFYNGLAAQHRLGFSRAQFAQGRQGGIDRVSGVGATQRFGEDITNAHSLHDRAHRTTSDNTGTGRRRFEHNFRSAVVSLDHERDRRTSQRHHDQVLFGILNTLADSLSILSRFAQAVAYMTIMIADNNQRADAETATALDHLGDAAHLHDSLFKVQF